MAETSARAVDDWTWKAENHERTRRPMPGALPVVRSGLESIPRFNADRHLLAEGHEGAGSKTRFIRAAWPSGLEPVAVTCPRVAQKTFALLS